MTRLLISVRNVTEARSAVAGGCDVLDLKEPENGALGMVDLQTMAAVCDFARTTDPALPVSVALGEALDWTGGGTLPRIPEGVRFLKLGTAGLGALPDWPGRFGEAVARFRRSAGQDGGRASPLPAGEGSGASGTSFGPAPDPQPLSGGKRGDAARAADSTCPATLVIAVAYADSHLARAPAPEEIVAAASACGCEGVLIDTFRKEAGRLTDWCDAARLRALGRTARLAGQMFAVAGSLRSSDLTVLGALDPDIIGIRSAACRAGIRTAEIDPAAVRAFREAVAALEAVGAF